MFNHQLLYRKHGTKTSNPPFLVELLIQNQHSEKRKRPQDEWWWMHVYMNAIFCVFLLVRIVESQGSLTSEWSRPSFWPRLGFVNSSKPKDSNRGVGPSCRPLALPYSKEDLVVCFLRCSIELIGCGKELDSAERTTIFTTEKWCQKGRSGFRIHSFLGKRACCC